MIRYYLVNGKAVGSHKAYIQLLELAFGIQNGRLIAVPNKDQWTREVLQGAEKVFKTLELLEFSKRLKEFVNNSVIRYDGIPDGPWPYHIEQFENLISAIISSTNDDIQQQYVDKFIPIESLPPRDNRQAWDVTRPAFFLAQPQQFASLLEPIFRASTGECLYIIDPYFDIHQHSQSLEAILRTAVGKMNQLKRVEFHIGNAKKPAINYIRDGWIKHLNKLRNIFRNMQSLVCCCWEPEVNHQRYVITRHGGFQFDAGIMPRHNEKTSAISLSNESADQIIAYYNPKYNYNKPHHNNVVGGRLNRPTTSDDIIGIVHYGDLPQHFENVAPNKIHRIQ